MNRFTMSNVALLMSYKVSPKEIERIVDRLDITPARDVEIADPQEVRVAAAQVLLRRYTSLTEYVADMSRYVADAVNQRAKLVCFPACAGLLPAYFLPQLDSILKKLRPEEAGALLDPEAAGDFLSYFSDSLFDAYYHTMSALAARHNIYIAAGSSLYFPQSSLCHRALLFDSGGGLAGYQDKLSLSPLEMALGLEPANEIKVFSSPAGPLALLIGGDAEYFEIARAARNLGARVLVNPTAYLQGYSPVQTTLGVNMRAQESGAWGVRSVLVGDTGIGFSAAGMSAIFGPVELTGSRNGTLAQGSENAQPGVVCDTLRLSALAGLRNPYTSDRNLPLLEKYIGRLY